MSKRHLPPLNTLRIFETAARCGSFSEAAKELGITHGAVSRQIKVLEEWLGQALFMREGKRCKATDHARAFATEISASFDLIADATTRFGRSPGSRIVRINAQTTLATRWLLPRLAAFTERHPDIEIAVTTSHSHDLKGQFGFDILIRRETPQRPEWRSFERIPLFTEQLTLLAAPALLQRQPLTTLSDLASYVFISSQSRVGEWESWLEAAGVADLRGKRYQRFDHYHVCLQAIVEGIGVGIGGLPTLAHELQQQRLVAPFEISVPGSHYALWLPPDIDKSASLLKTVAWLQQEAKQPVGFQG